MARKLTKKDRVYLEPLAKLLHEAGNYGAKGCAVRPGREDTLVPWAVLSDDSREIRMLAAAWLTDRRRASTLLGALDTADER